MVFRSGRPASWSVLSVFLGARVGCSPQPGLGGTLVPSGVQGGGQPCIDDPQSSIAAIRANSNISDGPLIHCLPWLLQILFACLSSGVAMARHARFNLRVFGVFGRFSPSGPFCGNLYMPFLAGSGVIWAVFPFFRPLSCQALGRAFF